MTNLARIEGPDFNEDLLALVTIDSARAPWNPTDVPGVSEKLFERIGAGPSARETALLRLEPGAVLPEGPAECRIDVLVLEGSVELGAVHHDAGMFVRVPAGIKRANDSTYAARSCGGRDTSAARS